MRPEFLCGLLAEPDRLRVFAAVVLGARSAGEVAQRTGLPARAVVAALHRFEQGGLVSTVGDGLVADTSAFKDAVREYAPAPGSAEPLDPDRQRDTVLRTFLVDGRLVRLPAQHSKRLIVLEHIVAAFEPGVKYPEKAVNAILRAWHADYAALRRNLVDEGLMGRDAGVYWRTGGYVEL
ncbi:MAG TPA: DUF2087 domain-containing protein [Micromonosporaceae bacterium]|nr:DUF2087 domain-containing protein [Micromonosporaceae bacterium]